METIEDIGTKMASESLKYFITNLLYTITLAIGSIIVARLLGPEKYGQYSITLLIPSILILFTTYGVPAGLLKYTSMYTIKNKILVTRYVKAALLFTIITGALMSIIEFIFANQFSILINRPELASFIRIVAVVVIMQTILNTLYSFLYGIGEAGLSGIINFILAITKAPLMIVLVVLGLGVLGALIGHIIGYIVAVAIGLTYVFIFLMKKLDKYRVTRQKLNPENTTTNINITYINMIKEMLKYGFPIYISVLLFSASSQYINMNLAWFVSNTEIGGYSVTTNISTAITLFLAPMTAVLFPSFSMIETKNSDALPTAFRRAVRISATLVIPIAIYISVFGEQIMRIIYGSKYLFAGIYITLYALAFIFQPLFVVMRGYFNGTGLTKETLKMHLIYFLTALIITPVLTSQLRVVGTIIAILLAIAIATAYAAYRCIKSKLSLEGGYLAKLIIIIIIAGIISSPIKILLQQKTIIDYIIVAGIGGVIYLTVLLTLMAITNIPSNEDINFIAKTLGQKPIIGTLLKIPIKYLKYIQKTIRKILELPR